MVCPLNTCVWPKLSVARVCAVRRRGELAGGAVAELVARRARRARLPLRGEPRATAPYAYYSFLLIQFSVADLSVESIFAGDIIIGQS